MPAAIPEALDYQEQTASDKAQLARSSPLRYFVSAALAGAYIGIAVVLLLMTSAPLIAAGSPFTKLVQGFVFGIALTLIVFAGAELFTGNNMSMAMGFLRRRSSPVDVLLVWFGSLFGNLVGSVAFAAMVNASGVVTAPGKGGAASPYLTALGGIIESKAHVAGGQLFFRAVLCNFLVCLAMWMAARAASDAAKLICLAWALLAFVASGFEHSVANMTIFALGAFTHVSSWSAMGQNLIWTVPGNIVGGALLVGAAYGYLGKTREEPTDERPVVLDEPAPLVSEPVLVGTAG